MRLVNQSQHVLQDLANGCVFHGMTNDERQIFGPRKDKFSGFMIQKATYRSGFTAQKIVLKLHIVP